MFSKWGRTGTSGQSQLDGPEDLAVIMKRFESKFQEKTGNQWQNRHTFERKVNKYDLLKVDHVARRATALSDVKAKWEYYIDDGVDGKTIGWYEYTASGTCQFSWIHPNIVRGSLVHSCIILTLVFSL